METYNNMLLKTFTIISIISSRVRGMFVQNTIPDFLNQQFYLKLYFNCSVMREQGSNLNLSAEEQSVVSGMILEI